MTLEELKIVITAETAGIKDEVAAVKRQLKGLDDNTKKSNSGMESLFSIAKVAAFVAAVKMAASAVNSMLQGYFSQLEAETKLETIMKQRMNATDQQISKVKMLAEEYEKLGVVEADVQLAGLQQLGTFLNQTASIEALLPALNDLLVQQNGVNATTGDAVNLGNMFGKVMQGEVGALKRVGISFSEAQEQVLKYGNELERATMLSQVIKDNVGEMNKAITKTPQGKIKQMKQQFDALKDELAEELLPIVMELLEASRDFAVAIMPLVSSVLESFLVVAQPVVSVIAYMVELISALSGEFKILGPIIMGLVTVWGTYKAIMIGAAIAQWAVTTAKAAYQAVATGGISIPVAAAAIAGTLALTAGVISQVKGYEDGGMPDKGDFFYAGESGPEFVGTMGGKSTVANQNQIEKGIEAGTYKGMMRALSGSKGKQPVIKLTIDGYELKTRLDKVEDQKGTTLSMTNVTEGGGY